MHSKERFIHDIEQAWRFARRGGSNGRVPSFDVYVPKIPEEEIQEVLKTYTAKGLKPERIHERLVRFER